MLDCTYFYDCLQNEGVHFYSGVPDSLLAEICKCITTKSASTQHIIAANEGAAVALATGNHLVTGDVPMVYMQNSGLGNTVNPLLSLADPAVYSIPMLLMIGWRGEPGVKDEPQHVKQGEVTLDMLDSMGIPYEVISADQEHVGEVLARLVAQAKEGSRPVALVVKKGTFAKYENFTEAVADYSMTREEALQAILPEVSEEAVIVSTTGKCSREIYEYRVNSGGTHERDFLTVGSMGHCSQIALGIALADSQQEVVCIDGDGAVLMHMGSLAVSGLSGAKNLLHIIINNGAHDSVGGQPTVGFAIDFQKVAEGCGYMRVYSVSHAAEVKAAMEEIAKSGEPSLLEVKTRTGARGDLGRPTSTPEENKQQFIDFLRK